MRSVAISLFCAMATAFAEDSFTGHLMPFKCRNDERKSHTRVCALRQECRDTGYGLTLADGSFVAFDAKGNEEAARILLQSSKTDDLVATVSGSKEGTKLRVRSIRLH
jgi:hypothetical protein